MAGRCGQPCLRENPGVNGESSVQIDRGHWLYRFALDTGNIAIYRARRAGQSLTTRQRLLRWHVLIPPWRARYRIEAVDRFHKPTDRLYLADRDTTQVVAWGRFTYRTKNRRRLMAWTRPTLREICVGMEINGYFTARI